jgi:hypothetical protein
VVGGVGDGVVDVEGTEGGGEVGGGVHPVDAGADALVGAVEVGEPRGIASNARRVSRHTG